MSTKKTFICQPNLGKYKSINYEKHLTILNQSGGVNKLLVFNSLYLCFFVFCFMFLGV